MWSDRSSSLPSSSHLYPSSAQSPRHSTLLNRPQLNSQSVNEASSPLQSAAASNRDPLEILELVLDRKTNSTITDGDISDVTPDDESVIAKPDELVDDIDFGDLSLEEFVEKNKGLEKTTSIGSPRYGLDAQGTEQYHLDRSKFHGIHDRITECDQVLGSVEAYLFRFQTDLGSVSSEIESLQARSTQLNLQFENRRSLEKALTPAIRNVTISSRAARIITSGPVDDVWISTLTELDSKIAHVNATEQKDKAQAIGEAKPFLTDLQEKAIEKIRGHFNAQLRALKSPVSDITAQQKDLVKFRPLYDFLRKYRSQLADSFCQAYLNTVKSHYFLRFVNYGQSLEKIKLWAMDKTESLGNESSSRSIPQMSRPINLDPFILGHRIDILRDPISLPPTFPSDDKSLRGLEVPFSYFNASLIRALISEFTFMTEMFTPGTLSFHEASRRVVNIFTPIFAQGQALTRFLTETSMDCLGILLCVRLNQQFAFKCQKDKVPVAETYLNATNMILWPRFQVVMDMHRESFQKAMDAVAGHNDASAAAAAAAATATTAPHVLTQRFGQFLDGVLRLSSETQDDEPVSNSLARLVSGFDALLAKLAAAGGNVKDPREEQRRKKFLVNNYSLILTIISDAHGKLASEQKEHFNEIIRQAARR